MLPRRNAKQMETPKATRMLLHPAFLGSSEQQRSDLQSQALKTARTNTSDDGVWSTMDGWVSFAETTPRQIYAITWKELQRAELTKESPTTPLVAVNCTMGVIYFVKAAFFSVRLATPWRHPERSGREHKNELKLRIRTPPSPYCSRRCPIHPAASTPNSCISSRERNCSPTRGTSAATTDRAEYRWSTAPRHSTSIRVFSPP